MATIERVVALDKRGAIAALAAAAGLLLVSAGFAGAAEVVDLRVGAHDEYTRVVFELDSPAGYRIERSTPSPGSHELVVSIDATSIPRKLQSSKSLIGLVRISPSGNRSVAHIQLERGGLSLKEMILANPPRIVLDVLSPTPVAAKSTKKKTVAKAAPKPAPKPATTSASKPTPKPAPTSAATSATQSAPQSAPKSTKTTTPAPPRHVAAVVPKPAAKKSAPKPAPAVPIAKPVAKPVPAPSSVAKTRPGSVGEPSEGGIPTMGMGAPEPSAAPSVAGTTPDFKDRGPTSAGSLTRTDRPRLPDTHPSVSSKSKPLVPLAEEDSGLSTTTLAAGAVGLVLLVGGFLMMKRRGAAAAYEDDEDEDGIAYDGESSSGDNPFSGLASQDGRQPTLPISDEDGEADGLSSELDFGTIDDDDKPVEPVHSHEQLKTDAGLAAGGAVSQGMGNAGAGDAGEQEVSEEVMRLIREFEQRLESVETRLDEAVDAKERLERQVAAQTEELRVQRAAIARTQRAVRNLSRPEEDGPTEPALREP